MAFGLAFVAPHRLEQIVELGHHAGHIFTPETNHSIHYWWFCSRNFRLDDAAIDEHLHTASTQAYQEDVDALEWILDVVRNDSEPQFDLNFAPDKPGLMMRQILYRLAAAEAGA